MKRILCLVWAASLAMTTVGQGIPGAAVAPQSGIDPLTGLPITPRSNEPRFDIEFPGGVPELLVMTIEKITKTHPNIVIHPECRSGEVPQFKLRDVTASQIFNTLNSLAEPDYLEGIWRQVPISDGEVWTLTKYNPKAPGGGYGGNYAGMAMAIQPSAPPQPRSCKIFNLNQYLETFTVEDITTAIQGAWDLMKSDTNPNIKYHKDTKLLIVVGSVSDLAVVADVLQELIPSLHTQKKELAPVQPAAENKK